MSQISKFYKLTETKIKTSFILIRRDLDSMQTTIDAMKKYLKKKDQEYQNQNSHITKSQAKIQNNIEEFDQKIIQIKLALSQINTIKQEVVIRKDLARIEDRIKISFKQEIEKYKTETITLREALKESQKRIKTLEKGIPIQKKSWFNKTNP